MSQQWLIFLIIVLHFLVKNYRQNYRQKTLLIRNLATSGDWPQVPYKQRVIGSSPITPTKSKLKACLTGS